MRSRQTKSSPQILFVRLGKEPTKDSIQKKIFKCVKSVLEDSVNDKGKRNNEKSCEVCPGIRSDEVREVALGPEFIGIVLNNGRVCRLKCSSNTLDSSKKPKKTQSSKSEDIFQVQSDEAYARRVQDQLNTVEVNSTSLSSTLDPLLTPSPDILMPETAESLLPEMNFFSSDSDQTSSVPFSSIEDNPEAINNDRDAGLDSVSTPRGLVTERTSLPVVSRNPLAQLGQNGAERPLQKETTSKNITADVVSNADSPNQSTKQDETRKRSFDSSSDSKVKAGSSATETRTSTSVSSLISHDKSQTSQSSLAIQESRNNSQTRSDITFFPRRSIASPTFIQRTIFPADPFYYRPPRGILNAPMILPRPGTLYSFDSRRLRDTFGSRSSIRYQPQGRTVHHFGPPSRSLGNHSDSTRRGRAQPGDSGRKGGVEDENAKFFYPKLGELEWLETETVSAKYV